MGAKEGHYKANIKGKEKRKIKVRFAWMSKKELRLDYTSNQVP